MAFAKLAAILAVGILVSLTFPPLYTSGAVMVFGPPSADRPHLESYRRLAAAMLSRESLSAVIQRPDVNLFPGDGTRMPLENVIAKMREDLRVAALRPAGPFTPFEIAFTYTNRFRAQGVVQVPIARLIDEGRRLQSRTFAGAAGPQRAERIARNAGIPPGLPVFPGSWDRWNFIRSGAGIGIAAAAIVSILRPRLALAV